MNEELSNELVRYSRAGDAFHYRWAARRCLRMIHPTSSVEYIIIEGSNENDLAGEYVIDVSEYLDKNESGQEQVNFFQLKHTTVHQEDPFNLSDLKKTISGFADRYRAYYEKNENKNVIRFYLVTNRQISKTLKDNLEKIRNNKKCDKRFLGTIMNYTSLSGSELVEFCNSLEIIDGLGDYNEQMMELWYEVSHLFAGTIDHPQIDTITALVTEKALPKSDGIIYPEDILKRFGYSSKRDMYPAPPEFEKSREIIVNRQHKTLVKNIIKSREAVIIHADGGVGKSVFGREIQHLLNDDSIAIIYDCFGAGKYRNRSQPRHRHRDGLIQIVNELAAKGLCDPLIIQSSTLEDEIVKKFLLRLQTAINNLKVINPEAKIIIVIDAADNAEMAAAEFGQISFVHEILREKMPDDCHLVMLCRTERVYLLQPSSSIKKYKLLPFTKAESYMFLQRYYPNATESDGLEFHRLTNGNPRIQANALEMTPDDISKLFKSLGPKGTSIEDQIEGQLEIAIEKVKDKFTKDFQRQIDAICCGLATLPPFIPITLLAIAAEVDEAAVRSFVADLGRPIWITDTVIQFRDEPTETWFKQRFSGTPQQIRNYIELLKPLSGQFTYVAEVLPLLYLESGEYEELIKLALSDEFLPNSNPIDKRNVKVFRLQFAFKAALKAKRFNDAVKIAFLAGEEMAGNRRQMAIFKTNIDLIAPLQDTQKVQELAFKGALSSAWNGSENVFSASLLSNVPEFHGEARSYLRAAHNWMNIYFEERKKQKKDRYVNDKLENEDIAEMAFAHYNLTGIEDAVKFMLGWKPPVTIYNVASIFARKMIDLDQIDILLKMSVLGSREVFFTLAFTNELLKVGVYLPSSVLMFSLEELSKGKPQLPRLEDYSHNPIMESVISFAEVCSMYKIHDDKVVDLLKIYFPSKSPLSIGGNYKNEKRGIFLRNIALMKTLCPELDISPSILLPEKYTDKKEENSQSVREYKEMIGGLTPWYLARIDILLNNDHDLENIVLKAQKESDKIAQTRYQRYDVMPYEVSQIVIDILLFSNGCSKEQTSNFFSKMIINNKHLWMDSLLQALRGANRCEHLSGIRNQINEYVYDFVESCTENTETKANYYISLARATMAISIPDSREYFNMAIEEVSRFGDEIIERWQATQAVANRCCSAKFESEELAYRFIRCAELVGENVESERYIDRESALRICTQLSPSSGLAAVSRWQDRAVGSFEPQFFAVIRQLMDQGYILPLVAWSLSPFLEEGDLSEFAMDCIKKEPSRIVREKLLNLAIDYLEIYNTPAMTWYDLKKLTDDLGINNQRLERICLFRKREQREYINLLNNKTKTHTIKESKLKKMLAGLDLTNVENIEIAYHKFRKLPEHYNNESVFWSYVFTQIPEGDVAQFLYDFVSTGQIDIYAVADALPNIPEYWRKKPSVKKCWPEIIKKAAKTRATDLLTSYSIERFVKTFNIVDTELNYMYLGIIEGLSNQDSLNTSEDFFGFIKIVTNILEPIDAKDLVSFSLARFEIHMEDNFADGKWDKWLQAPTNSSEAIAGFIWAALGSPITEIRWKAAHCCVRLGLSDCQDEVDALLNCLNENKVNSFGCDQFIFYYLHARLYLLIALARLSVDKPEMLMKNALIFSHYALDDLPHILMQVFASKIALNLEKSIPKTYEIEVYHKLLKIGISPYPIKKGNKRRDNIPSYLHKSGKVDKSLHFSHGYDFDQYWFEPLGRVFGVTGKQIAELATMAIVEDLKIDNDGSYNSDPRQNLWSSTRYQSKTYHSHGGYPSVDNYSFYLSYHSMFIVAYRLLQNMPVRDRDYWEEDVNAWDYWLKNYLLTREDGYWIFDRRDGLPLKEPSWLIGGFDNDWASSVIEDNYFLQALSLCDEKPDWINTYGSWTYEKNDQLEDVHIYSALVSCEAAQALLNSLSTYNNPYDYKLPEYNDEEFEYNLDPFKLKGWIVDRDSERGIDQLDKLSGQVSYPVYRVGDSIAEKLKIQTDNHERVWNMGNEKKLCLVCKDWGYEVGHYDESRQISGIRLSASMDFIKKLCVSEECNMIIEVQIKRGKVKSRYSSYDADNTYRPPKHKIYLISQEGEITDEKGCVKFR